MDSRVSHANGFGSGLVPFGIFLHISQCLDEHPKDLPIAKIHIQDAFQLFEVAVIEYPPVEILRPYG